MSDAVGGAGSAEAVVAVCNARGLHARAAARFVRLAEQFTAKVAVTRDDLTVPGTSILGLMMLGAGPGVALTIRAEGEDAERAVADLVDLVARRFDEES